MDKIDGLSLRTEYYSATERKEMETQVLSQMNPEHMILNGKSQS